MKILANHCFPSDIDRQISLGTIQADTTQTVSSSKDTFQKGVCLASSSYPPG